MSPEIVSKVIKAYFKALRDMDQEAWVNTFATDAISYDPVGAQPTEGHQRLGEFFETITAPFNEVGLTENQVFVAGNEAAVKWTGSGISKQGRKVHFEGIDVFEINEAGKIQKLRAYWNPAELVSQL
ncbi:MAG: nuclear transport factor 2 family protein [Pyrinomonadaceae bacterium]